MKKITSDITIVGAGLTGLMSAFALSDLNIDIVVIDKFDFFSKKNNNADLRTTAISEGSKYFLDRIKIWDKIKSFSEPIKDIKVIDRQKKTKIDFCNQAANHNLGYIIKNNIIKKILLEKLIKKKNIRLISNNNLKTIDHKQSSLICTFKEIKIDTKLLIAADGKNSKVRNIFRTPVYKKDYKQKALVVNFLHEKDHSSTAHELFFKSGPLAILPMKKNKKNIFSSSLIWSHESEFIDSLSKIDKDLLISLLEEKIYNYVGKIKKIAEVQTFNLSAHINRSFFENRVLYLGDSAHSIHPIAGQGWNLGIRDIEKCLEVLRNGMNMGLDIGSKFICEEYNNKTFYDSYTLFQITDKLNSIFLNDNFLVNKFREQGFSLINKNQNIRNFITNFAMGFN